MVKIYTALVFLFLKICGLVCNEKTTYFNVHPEQDRYEMQVLGVSSEPRVERYSVEKISQSTVFNKEPLLTSNSYKEAGFPRPKDEEFECNSPPHCLNCTVCSVCDNIGSIPQECPGSKRHQYRKQLSVIFPRRRSYKSSRQHAKKFSRLENNRLQWRKAFQLLSRQYY